MDIENSPEFGPVVIVRDQDLSGTETEFFVSQQGTAELTPPANRGVIRFDLNMMAGSL